MNWITASCGVLAFVPAIVSARIALFEVRRFRQLRRSGVRASGEIISQAQRRIGEAPLPIVIFKDAHGIAREFRSRYPRRTKGFVQPEKVEVLYLSHAPEVAEIDSFAPMFRWCLGCWVFAAVFLAGGVVLIAIATT